MATCPKCGGFLSDDHRCAGAWRRTARAIAAPLAGALLGIVTASMLAERPSNGLLAVAGLLGAVLVAAAWRASGLS